MANYCSNCGKKVEESDKFCIYCGTKLRNINPEKNVKRTSNKTINNEKTSKYVEVIDGIMRYKVFPSSLVVKYTIYKVKFGTTNEEIKEIFKNKEYSYKIDIYYFRENQKLYYRGTKDPNIFSKYYNYNLNKEMKKDRNEIFYLYSYLNKHNIYSRPKVINFNGEKTFILENKLYTGAW